MPPSLSLAESRSDELGFKAAKTAAAAPSSSRDSSSTMMGLLWATSPEDFRRYSTAVRLYFVTLRTLSWVFLAISLCHLPSLLLCLSGSATADEDRDPMLLYSLSLGNVGTQSGGGEVHWLGRYPVSRTSIGARLSQCAALGSSVLLLGWFSLRSATTAAAASSSHHHDPSASSSSSSSSSSSLTSASSVLDESDVLSVSNYSVLFIHSFNQ